MDVNNERISNHKDALFIFLLTSDENEPLFQYNFCVLNRVKIKDWKDKPILIQEIKKFINSGKWKSMGNPSYLERLLEELE